MAGFRMATVFAAPAKVTVEVPLVNVEPAPLVFQDPVTVHEPAVRMIVPDAPPAMVTSPTATDELPALNVAPLFTTRFPPLSERFAVDKVALLLSAKAPFHRRPFVAMVNVAAAVGLTCTLLNSTTGKAPNVITREALALNTTVPVPAFQDADAEAFVQVPPMAQVSEPKTK